MNNEQQQITKQIFIHNAPVDPVNEWLSPIVIIGLLSVMITAAGLYLKLKRNKYRGTTFEN